MQMGAFYEKNGEIFGNIGFDKSISYANEGSICAWYQNHEYRLVCENSVAKLKIIVNMRYVCHV